MALAGRYSDGLVSGVRNVSCRIDGSSLVIVDAATLSELDRWNVGDVFPLHGRRNEVRVGVGGKPYGARLVFEGRDDARAAHEMLPALGHKHRHDRGREVRAIGLATLALVSVVVAWIYGVPLLARNLVATVPPAWEEQLGESAVVQIEALIKEQGGFEVCDPNPNSLANRAIARFAAQAVEGTGTPFAPDIKVIRSAVPNAFALPGGHSFYFSALLEQTNTPDEFAGVMAHELGHVVHRHGMEQLISTSATGLLIGFILGDMTGLSVAGGIGAALVDSRFSREAEREADRFAADVARRMNFQAAGLVDLLERVSGDNDMSKALALLSTHPLTSERRANLEALAVVNASASPAFTPEEWAAIKSMCGGGAGTSAPSQANPAALVDRDSGKNG
jgi:predicted Zn-dependent protease